MKTEIDGALARLNRRLPLAERQAALPRDVAAVHRAILRSLYETGQAPAPQSLAALLDGGPVGDALAKLGAEDLVVLSEDRSTILGAYPMTTETTPHRLLLPGRTVHAMCAVDALSVTAMYGGEIEIESKCRVTRDPVRVCQSGEKLISASPAGVLVGVRWEHSSCGHAAHSLCMEMVFLRDAAAAQEWHKGDLANHTVLPLEDAIVFGSAFFKPLVG